MRKYDKDISFRKDYECTPVKDHCGTSWNVWSRLPVDQWLSPTQSQSDRDRLHMMGNQVIPQQAFLGFETLLRMRRAARAI